MPTSIRIFYDVTPCTFEDSITVLERHRDSIFRSENKDEQIHDISASVLQIASSFWPLLQWQHESTATISDILQ